MEQLDRASASCTSDAAADAAGEAAALLDALLAATVLPGRAGATAARLLADRATVAAERAGHLPLG